MTFAGFEYLAFLALVAVVFWSVPPRVRPALLLVASYVFYGLWNWRYLFVLAGVTVATWLLSRQMTRFEGARRRNLMILTVAVAGTVFYAFKAVGGSPLAGGGLAVGFGNLAFDSVVPIGLAFYTFQVIAYVVDLYRGEIEEPPTLWHYATYVAFFPHLLAGPIVRARRLIPQLAGNSARPDRVRLVEGIELIFLGLFKKVAVADPLVHLASVAWGTTGGDTSTSTLQGVLTGGVALIGGFFDIAGYIDIARGSAKVLGIDMPANFAQPLTRSRNWTEFWRRWQMTIMAWFRDYVFLPIRGRGRTLRAEATGLLAVFLLAGSWHGLTWGWLTWGLLTATLLITEQRVRKWRSKRRRARGTSRRRLPAPVRAVSGPAYVFTCIALTTPFAISPTFADVVTFYQRFLGGGWGGVDLNVAVFWAWGVVVLVVTDQYERHRSRVEGLPDPITTLRALGYGVAAVALVVFAGSGQQQFVYFQF